MQWICFLGLLSLGGQQTGGVDKKCLIQLEQLIDIRDHLLWEE